MNHSINRIVQLGNFHDSVVRGIAYDARDGRIEISVHDLYANFSGEEEYPGEQSGSFLLIGVKEFRLQISDRKFEDGKTIEDTTIYEVDHSISGAGIEVRIKLSPSGTLSAICDNIKIIETHAHLWS